MARYTNEQFFDLFAGKGVTPAEVAAMGRKAVLEQVTELLGEWQDRTLDAQKVATAILDYAYSETEDDICDDGLGCPHCGERSMAHLEWDKDGEELTCASCGTTYTPGG